MVMFLQEPKRKANPFVTIQKRRPRPFVQLKPRQYHDEGFNTRSLPSCSSAYDKARDPLFASKTRYEGEMADREAAARVEIERKKTMVAPLYNKGPYQMITSAEQCLTIGRK